MPMSCGQRKPADHHVGGRIAVRRREQGGEFELARMLAWVKMIALGVPVDPDVSWYIAMADLSGCNGSMAAPGSKAPRAMTTLCPAAFSGFGCVGELCAHDRQGCPYGAPRRDCVSANHVARSVRGVGCSQHRQRCAPHPHRLSERGDVGWIAGQHRDRGTRHDTHVRQRARHPSRFVVHLAPTAPDRVLEGSGDHPARAGRRIGVHVIGEAAHAYALPLSYVVDALQQISANTEATPRMWRDVGVVVAFIIAAVLGGAATLRRQEASRSTAMDAMYTFSHDGVTFAVQPAEQGRQTAGFVNGLFGGGWIWEPVVAMLTAQGYGTVVTAEPLAAHETAEDIPALLQSISLLVDTLPDAYPILRGTPSAPWWRWNWRPPSRRAGPGRSSAERPD